MKILISKQLKYVFPVFLLFLSCPYHKGFINSDKQKEIDTAIEKNLEGTNVHKFLKKHAFEYKNTSLAISQQKKSEYNNRYLRSAQFQFSYLWYNDKISEKGLEIYLGRFKEIFNIEGITQENVQEYSVYVVPIVIDSNPPACNAEMHYIILTKNDLIVSIKMIWVRYPWYKYIQEQNAILLTGILLPDFPNKSEKNTTKCP